MSAFRAAPPATRLAAIAAAVWSLAATSGALAQSHADPAPDDASHAPAHPLGTAHAGSGRVITNGLIGPETALYDDREDQFVVSNLNGALTAKDDNGFISRLSSDGRVVELHWIDGLRPGFTLHAPKGMAFRGDELVVADLEAVRIFDRKSGKHLRDYEIPDSYMLNDVAIGDDGKIYVTDTGGDYGTPPGAVYAIGDDGKPQLIAKGPQLERPNGLVFDKGSLLVAAFSGSANDVYRLDMSGHKTPYATLPAKQLDGLARLPDGTLLVTSWAKSTVYRLLGSHAERVADGILTPAQICYDPKHSQLLVPDPLENEAVLFPIEWR